MLGYRTKYFHIQHKNLAHSYKIHIATKEERFTGFCFSIENSKTQNWCVPTKYPKTQTLTSSTMQNRSWCQFSPPGQTVKQLNWLTWQVPKFYFRLWLCDLSLILNISVLLGFSVHFYMFRFLFKHCNLNINIISSLKVLISISIIVLKFWWAKLLKIKCFLHYLCLLPQLFISTHIAYLTSQNERYPHL